MGGRPGIEVLGIALCGLAFGGCWETKTERCETDYYADPNGNLKPVNDCDGSDDSGYDYPAPCDGVEKSLGRVVELSRGPEELVDAFVADSGIIVVTRSRIALFDRNGAELGAVAAGISTAGFNGSILTVTSRNAFVSYDTRLNKVGQGALGTPCASSVVVSGPRFVCGDGPTYGTEYERTYSTYDALTGALISSTTNPFYEEGPMGRVPGRDAFVTINPHVSPRHLVLFGVDSMGQVQGTAGTQDDRDNVTLNYALVGNPADHLINDRGLLLCLTPEDCGNTSEGGLKLERNVANLPDGHYFGAMDVDPTRKLHAIAGPYTSRPSDNGPTCEDGCTFERIDVASGTVEASAEFELEAAQFVMLVRADPQGGIVLACGPGGGLGHRVALLPEAP